MRRPHLHQRLRRFPFLYWLVALSLAAFTGTVIAGLAGDAQARSRAWGERTGVPVVAAPVPAGRVITEADVVRRSLPAVLLPRSRVVDDPVGRVAVVDLVAGEVLTESKLAPWGVRGLGALLPRGTRALAVPRDDTTPRLRRGDRVDLLATFADSGPDVPPTVAVATAALVIDAGEDAVTVAVRPREAPRVAFALAQGVVTLALAG